jgi:phospholipase C
MTSNLEKIDHIVVLMLENRSFDHMLGHLTLEGGRPEVDGLKPEHSNDHNGVKHRVFRLVDTVFSPDPGHGSRDVADQLARRNGGFIDNFAQRDSLNPQRIMGYYNAATLPVYDYLAREYCVCDAWFASVPGPTWPNRLYALTGNSDGDKDNRFKYYSMTTVFDHLSRAGVSWNYFCDDFPFLAVLPRSYNQERVRQMWDFFPQAEAGSLASVTWIDPNFEDIFGGGNDDHPPADIGRGQTLVGRIYNALVTAGKRTWERTMFIVLYDEHGGFFDHVQPPDVEDDRPGFRRLGVRIPALVASPWIKSGTVGKEVYDHTSLLKTILLRFCRRRNGSIPPMGTRVNAARDLGALLSEPIVRSDCRPYAGTSFEALARPLEVLPGGPARTELQELIARYKADARSTGGGWRFVPPRPAVRHAAARSAAISSRVRRKEAARPRRKPSPRRRPESR